MRAPRTLPRTNPRAPRKNRTDRRHARDALVVLLSIAACAQPRAHRTETELRNGMPPSAAHAATHVPDPPATPGTRDVETDEGRETPDAPAPDATDGPLPIDLPTALRLAGANSLEIEFARERLAEARATLDAAQVLWVPTFRAGAAYSKHEGRLQATEGEIVEVSRNAGGVEAGLIASFHLSDALFEPLAARRRVGARRAGVTATRNDTLLDVALAYTELVSAQAALELARRVEREARELAELARGFARTGQGLEADAARARDALAARERDTVAVEERIRTRAVRLATLLELDPTAELRAADPQLLPTPLLDESVPLRERVEQGLAARPELRESRETLESLEAERRQQRLRPFIPEIRLGVSGGGFGGGTGSDFDDFSDRGDFTGLLVWEIRNLGLGEGARRREARARERQARARLARARNVVVAEVTDAWHRVASRKRRIEIARRSVTESERSLDLNLRRIRGAEGLPIEALQAIDAADRARRAHLEAVVDYNRAHLELLHAVGRPPGDATASADPVRKP